MFVAARLKRPRSRQIQLRTPGLKPPMKQSDHRRAQALRHPNADPAENCATRKLCHCHRQVSVSQGHAKPPGFFKHACAWS